MHINEGLSVHSVNWKGCMALKLSASLTPFPVIEEREIWNRFLCVVEFEGVNTVD